MTDIEWTRRPGTIGVTWNVVVGCSLASPGCTNCYAMRDAWRKGFNPVTPQYHGLTKKVNGKPVWNGKVHFVEHKLLEPLAWRKPRTVFVNSMGDLFHESIPDAWIDRVFGAMEMCPQHIFQVLTKRSERQRDYINKRAADAAPLRSARAELELSVFGDFNEGKPFPWPLPNVWLGVSTERQQEADERIPHLLQTPAAVRFISAEPLLGPVDLTNLDCGGDTRWNSLGGRGRQGGLDWVIAGGESGKDARPMHPDHARSLRDQCAAAGVPFFFKQWGEFCPAPPLEPATHAIFPDGRCFRAGAVMGATDIDAATQRALDKQYEKAALYTRISRVGKKAAGRLLDGKEHNAFPAAAPERAAA